METRATVLADTKAKHSSSCSFHCGTCFNTKYNHIFVQTSVHCFLVDITSFHPNNVHYFSQVETPSGLAKTHRFATETVDLPSQEGERVTIALAAPSSVYREFGPLKLSSRVPKFYPEEPMCLKNHKDGRESRLLRAPEKDSGPSIFNTSILFPVLAVLATGDTASGIIDPSLPQLISVAAISSLAIGATFSGLVLPQLNKASP